jgi:membrane-associated protein
MIDLSSLAIDSPISYAVAVLLPAFDAVLPILPSETAVIALGVATAGSTDPRIFLLVGLAALGAFAGDNLCYYLGHRFGAPVERRFLSGEKGSKARAWAEQALDRYGARLIIACRFIPGGRTAVTLTCGLIGYPRRSFVPATAVAGVIWASYAFLIGRLGGAAFERRPWIGLLLGLGIALAVSGLIELMRRTGLWAGLSRQLSRLRHRRQPAGSGAANGHDAGAAGGGGAPDGSAVDGSRSPDGGRTDHGGGAGSGGTADGGTRGKGGGRADRSGPGEGGGPGDDGAMESQLPQRAGGRRSSRS